MVKQLSVKVDRLLRKLDRTAREQSPRAAEKVDWLIRQTLNLVDGNVPLPTVINATGTLLSASATIPWADAAIAEFCRLASQPYATTTADLLCAQHRVATQLNTLVPCDDAQVFSTSTVAATAAIKAIMQPAPGRLMVPKRHVVNFLGTSVIELAARAGVEITEMGTVDDHSTTAYEQGINEASCQGLLLVASSFVPPSRVDYSQSLRELSAIARAAGKPVLILADDATPATVESPLYDAPPTWNDLLPLADLLVLPGDRLLGGPACGLVLGGDSHIETVRQCDGTIYPWATPPTLAALIATLQIWAAPQQRGNLPVWQLFSATAETVQSRTGRLIEQCAELANGVRVRPSSSAVRLESTPFGRAPADATALLVSHATLDADQLQSKLLQRQPRILGAPNSAKDGLILQLASLLPRQDGQIAEALQSI